MLSRLSWVGSRIPTLLALALCCIDLSLADGLLSPTLGFATPDSPTEITEVSWQTDDGLIVVRSTTVDQHLVTESVALAGDRVTVSVSTPDDSLVIYYRRDNSHLSPVAAEYRTSSIRQEADLRGDDADSQFARLVSPSLEDTIARFRSVHPFSSASSAARQCIAECDEQCEKYPSPWWLVCYLSCEAGCLIGAHI